jgi:hypothetical protein
MNNKEIIEDERDYCIISLRLMVILGLKIIKLFKLIEKIPSSKFHMETSIPYFSKTMG